VQYQRLAKVTGSGVRKPPNAGKGRKAGVPNKTTSLLKNAILMAAQAAGGAKGIAGYFEAQAKKNPGPFMALLGKVSPLQVVSGDPENPLAPSHTVEIVFVAAKNGQPLIER